MSAEWGTGMGMMLLAMISPSSLMAAMKAGTRMAWGDCWEDKSNGNNGIEHMSKIICRVTISTRNCFKVGLSNPNPNKDVNGKHVFDAC